MARLTGAQKQYLKGLAHGLKPVVLVGQKQLTPTVIREIDQALSHHELIKIKLIDQKDKANKKEIAQSVLEKTGCHLVGMIGHILILYRWQADPEKRKITLPKGVPKQTESTLPTPEDDPL
jgi:RNA-binding protein